MMESMMKPLRVEGRQTPINKSMMKLSLFGGRGRTISDEQKDDQVMPFFGARGPTIVDEQIDDETREARAHLGIR